MFGDVPAARRSARNQIAAHLSGGEQQMLAIGRALMGNPRVLLMDEPSEGLAPQIVAEVMATIRKLKESGLSIVLVEQNPKLVFDIADDIVILNTGQRRGGVHAGRSSSSDGVDLRQHLGRVLTSKRQGTISNGGHLEQIRAHRGAQARQAGTRDAAEEPHRRHARPCRGAARRPRSSTPHLKHATDPLVAHFDARDQALMAKQAADIRTRIRHDRRALCGDGRDGRRHAARLPGAAADLLHLPLEVGVQAARALNDGIAEYVGKHNDRLVALGGVPMQDGNEAAKELERCMKQLEFKGVEILTNVNGKELSDPAFAPFWKKAEELDALVLIHPNGFTQPQRFGALLLQQRDRQSARHHDGAALPDLRRRVRTPSQASRFWPCTAAAISAPIPAASITPGARARMRTATCRSRRRLICSRTSISTRWCSRRIQLEALVKTYGADRIVLGTDYPFDMADYDPIGHVASVDELRRQRPRAAICGGNAKKLLGTSRDLGVAENPAPRFPSITACVGAVAAGAASRSSCVCVACR